MTQFLQRDSPIPLFFAYPKFLLTLDVSETAKMIYMLLLDRARLSMQKDGWQDEHGRVFIHYTIQSLAMAGRVPCPHGEEIGINIKQIQLSLHKLCIIVITIFFFFDRFEHYRSPQFLVLF